VSADHHDAESPTRRVEIGPVTSIPTTECVAVADGAAVAVRVGDEVCAYRNRCLHQDAPLAGGWVRNGVLSCPLHFWRYDVATGTVVKGSAHLDRFPVDVVDGIAYVEVPIAPPRRSLRDELLERARTYDRDDAWQRDRPD
jgi:nitrite reductase/ring-hydroxylating ferredoxin subunit